MLIVIALIAIIWLMAILLVIGACQMAARGDLPSTVAISQERSTEAIAALRRPSPRTRAPRRTARSYKKHHGSHLGLGAR